MGSYVNNRFRLFDRAALSFNIPDRSGGANPKIEIDNLVAILNNLVWDRGNFETIKNIFPGVSEERIVATIIKDFCDYYAIHDSNDSGYRKLLATRAIEQVYWMQSRKIVKLFLKKQM